MAVSTQQEEPLVPLLRRVVRSVVRPAYHARLRRVRARDGMRGIQVELYEAIAPRRVLAMFGARVGAGTVVYPRLRIHAGDPVSGFARLRLGERCHVGRDCFIDLTADVTFEDEAGIAMLTTILSETPGGTRSAAPVRLLRGAMTGACVTIFPGVTVGECSLIAAGSSVTADVPDRVVVAGSPARVVRRLPREDPP